MFKVQTTINYRLRWDEGGREQTREGEWEMAERYVYIYVYDVIQHTAVQVGTSYKL